MLEFAKSVHHLTSSQQQENASFLSMLEEVLGTPHLYFSYTTDLTRNVQRKWAKTQGEGVFELAGAVQLFTGWDERFVWNRHILNR